MIIEVYVFDVVRMSCVKGKKDGLFYEVKLIDLVVNLLNVLK